ncbi:MULTISPECIES: phage antirepressor KilAC domain-containing protein [unclassified Pseudomonas]|uniref:phage antirepressor KilAC domain-containing protein n=2 Tax=Pseudomonas TaxID=286 RepID=UPI000AF29E2A|nr:phage antirepressor KilAC domain-containing protein [Pseudomonas sp. EGD-AKN5]
MHIQSEASNHAPRFSASQNVARTMSSREISDLVESRHDNVKRTIERLSEKGIIRFTPSEETSHDGAGARPVEVYLVNKRDSFIVVAQLCPEFTARLVDRWQELEAQQALSPALPNFANPADAARAWAEQFEQRQAAEQALLIAAPKVDFVDRYVDAQGSMGFRQVAKLLKANEHQLRDMLIKRKVMYYLNGTLTAHSNHIAAGRFETRTGTSERNSHAYTQARFTPKGVQWVAGLWAEHQMEGQA